MSWTTRVAGAHRRAWDYNRLESFVQTSDKSFYNFFLFFSSFYHLPYVITFFSLFFLISYCELASITVLSPAQSLSLSPAQSLPLSLSFYIIYLRCNGACVVQLKVRRGPKGPWGTQPPGRGRVQSDFLWILPACPSSSGHAAGYRLARYRLSLLRVSSTTIQRRIPQADPRSEATHRTREIIYTEPGHVPP